MTPGWLMRVFEMAANRVGMQELGNGEIPEKVTRFEVIDETGRAYTRTGIHVKAVVQDDGRTLKIWVDHDKQALEGW